MLNDQQARNRFENELSNNFSVIASPGTGKTTAITRRIANIICAHKYPEILKNFLAVTYTEKAANEIKERVTALVRTKIQQHLAPQHASIGLNNIFFGTIHSLCAQLLRQNGSQISIKDDFEIIENDSECWENFTQSCIFSENFNETDRQIIKYFSLDKILDDARTIKPQEGENISPMLLNKSEVYNFFDYQPSPRETGIKSFQEDLTLWLQSGSNCPFPSLPKTSSKAFLEFLTNTGKNFVSWQETAYNYLIKTCAARYLQFRISNNVLTYDDLITLTLKLLNNENYCAQTKKNYQIILDEAQDTDPEQFQILINLSNKQIYEEIFKNTNKINLISPKFSFSMVGDPKQSIYSDRADVKFYMSVHNNLIKLGLLKGLSFDTTMRCDKKVVTFVNEKFSSIFSNFSAKPMQAHPESETGLVDVIKTKDNFETLLEILNQILSQRSNNIRKLSDIAILAPRKAWLNEIITKFRQFLCAPKLQLWANEDIASKPSLIKWVAAVLHYIFSPLDKKEFVGIAREIFGVPTDEIIADINHKINNFCAKIEDAIFEIKQILPEEYLPNVIRHIVDRLHLVERINVLGIYSAKELTAQYDVIMDTAYEIDSKKLGYRALEQKLIQLYQHFSYNMDLEIDAIQLLTYHKSKGLEWPIVVLPFLYREHKLSSVNSAEIDNEKRMLFVACTRAKNQLVLLDDSGHTPLSGRSNMISSGKILNNLI